jgi:hypothetical protein
MQASEHEQPSFDNGQDNEHLRAFKISTLELSQAAPFQINTELLKHVAGPQSEQQQPSLNDCQDKDYFRASKNLSVLQNYCLNRQLLKLTYWSNRLLDRSQALEQDQPSLDDGQDNEYLKAFKVANFAYAEDENVAGEIAQEDERLEAELEADKQRGRELWEELLKNRWEDEYVRQEIEMGKGRRSRKQVPDAFFCAFDL